jgi:hypothetical protein
MIENGDPVPDIARAIFARAGWADRGFAVADGEAVGRRMLAGLAEHTGLRLDDL